MHSEDKDPASSRRRRSIQKKATNYRRWWNNPWNVVEGGGQAHAGEWTPEKMARLRALVERAHANGLWIRFYTLDGASEPELSCHGWFHDYNFGSLDVARVLGGRQPSPLELIIWRPTSMNYWELRFGKRRRIAFVR